MEQRELAVELRSKTGKGISRQLRLKGLIPGVVYGKGIDPITVTVNPRELTAALEGEGGQNHLITLKGDGSLNGMTVIAADILRDSLRGDLKHVDLHKINLTETVRVQVAVTLVGTAAGVKEGGMLDVAMHSIEVECLPTQIPGHIDVDVTALTVGHSIHVSDLQLPAGIKAVGDPRASVVSILGKAKEEAPAAE
jgi:large subunit ribosomal protein L25